MTFTAELIGPQDSATTLEWDFDGDDVVDSLNSSPTYTYPDAYLGNVDLTITNSLDCTGSSITAIVVFPADGNEPPVAIATVSQMLANEGASVQLSASGSIDMNGDNLTYTWIQTSGPTASLSATTGALISVALPLVTSDSTVSFKRQRRYQKIRPFYEYEFELEANGEREVWKVSPSGYIQQARSRELYKMDVTVLKKYMQ